jgi:hypothetical protein
MGILDRLLGRKGDSATMTEEPPVQEECPHGSLVPRWDDPADLGNNEKVARYLCEACGAELSREAGEQAMATAGERVRIDEDLRKTAQEEAGTSEPS